MFENRWFLIFCLVAVLSGACQQKKPVTSEPAQVDYSIFQMNNLVAWCVVPFDSMKRGPAERAAMLDELGFKKFAYDWREHHLPSFPEEVEALRQHGIELTSVWWWIDGQGDQLLSPDNQRLLQYLDSLDISCDIWMSFDERFFNGLDDMEKLELAVRAVTELHDKVSAQGSRLMLYNHGAWFGDPLNQLEIIKKSGIQDIGIIYNFHHAHDQIEAFPALLKAMLPYLNTVNINGMNEEGPKILTVGQGRWEKTMLEELASSGFQGHIGIIGHLEQEDVREVLQRNIQGLEHIASEL